MKIIIDYRRCAKSGQCFYTFPELICKGGQDFPIPARGCVSDGQHQRAKELVDICPMGAIRLDADGHEEKDL
jgi:ferredoxin